MYSKLIHPPLTVTYIKKSNPVDPHSCRFTRFSSSLRDLNFHENPRFPSVPKCSSCRHFLLRCICGCSHVPRERPNCSLAVQERPPRPRRPAFIVARRKLLSMVWCSLRKHHRPSSRAAASQSLRLSLHHSHLRRRSVRGLLHSQTGWEFEP